MPDKAGPDQQVIALYQISDDLKGYNADKKKWDVSRRIRIDEVKNKLEEQVKRTVRIIRLLRNQCFHYMRSAAYEEKQFGDWGHTLDLVLECCILRCFWEIHIELSSKLGDQE